MIKKIAFIGSVGSGKTTIINQLSNIETLDTDVISSVDIGKEKTTVGMDYGYINIDENTTLALFGVPGQRKFSLVWDYVKEGLWAIVILIKNNERESINELDYLLEYFQISETMPFVVAVTHIDDEDANSTMNQIREKLQKKQLDAPIFSVDARKSDSAMLIMETLIALEENS